MSRRENIVLEDEDGLEHTMPTHFEVCQRCRGTGTHCNPSIDGNGITQSEMEELGDDFREDYLAGVYDVTCERCGGLRVVPVVDIERMSKAQRALWDAHEAAERESSRDYESERWLRYHETGVMG